MRRTAAERRNLTTKFPWARSLISVAARYSSDRPDVGIARHIARYAQGDDYHDVLDRPLEELETFIRSAINPNTGQPAKTRRYIDTGPILEKLYAAETGIGWLGKNTLVLNERLGSYLFLGEIITDLALPADPPATERCGTCTRCLDACPTNAFVAPYVLDATRCISYHTIESREPIPPDITARLEGNFFGCDICQEVCPWNREAVGAAPTRPEFETRPAYRTTSVEDMASMSVEAFRKMFRSSPLKRPGLEKLKGTVSLIADHPVDQASTKGPAEE